jgi:hypothetical protein
MRRFPPMEIFIVVLTLVMLVLGWRIYGAGEFGRFSGVKRAQHAPSQLFARMTVRYTKPPIYEEAYSMQDIEGVSSFQYQIRSYNCREITIKAPPAKVTDVSFFFGRLDQDGIWQLVNKAPLSGAREFYTVYVKQLADYKQGERTVTFTNPRYWAKAAGRQYSIDLSKEKPSDLLHLQSTQLADPRYQQIVTDFRNFGPKEFRDNIAAARVRVTEGQCK